MIFAVALLWSNGFFMSMGICLQLKVISTYIGYRVKYISERTNRSVRYRCVRKTDVPFG